MKRAPDVLLNLCNRDFFNQKIVLLTNEKKDLILKENHEFNKNALRINWRSKRGHQRML